MKSILVGKLNDKKVYYVVDSTHEDADCVLVGKFGDKQLTSFWKTVDSNPRITKIQNTDFHDYLWNGHQSRTNGHWYSVFVAKAVPVEKSLLDDVLINEDVLKRKPKFLDYENRAMEFRLARNTQVMSEKMIKNWINTPRRLMNRKLRKKKSNNAT